MITLFLWVLNQYYFKTLKATTTEELSVHKGDYVEILDDSRKWWKVRNQHGLIGFVPGNIMEAKQESECQEMNGSYCTYVSSY